MADSKGKIIIAGGNQTALFCAELAAKAGFQVDVFEKKNKEEVAYDWTDDAMPAAFNEVGLDLPQELYHRTKPATFISPDKSRSFFADLPEDQRDFALIRRPFNNWLEKRAVEAGATVIYGKSILRAEVKGGKVVGAITEDGMLPCDLLIDCAGIDSSIRASLPDEFKILKRIALQDSFLVRRTIFARAEGVPIPEVERKIYLKHQGEKGISWCALHHGGESADVLVGRLGELSDETYQRAFKDIKDDNPMISDTVLTGGELLRIPLRRPLSRLVGNGYALLGDSACMTVPLMGSGIANSMKAAKILIDVLDAPAPFTVENLYRYQQKFMKSVGAFNAAIDYLKGWLLGGRSEDINIFIDSGILGDALEAIEGKTGDLVKAILVLACKKPIFTFKLFRTAAKAGKVALIGFTPPKSFSETKLSRWEKRYNRSFQKKK